MSRPGKRIRQEIDCDGTGCGNAECISCYSYASNTRPAGTYLSHNVAPMTLGQPTLYVPPGSSGYIASHSGRPSLPAHPAPPPPTAVNPALGYDYMISRLDNDTVRLILASLASVSPSVQTAVISSYQQKVQMMQARVIDFDTYSKTAWHILNTSGYTEGSGSEQFEASFDARADIVECINDIGKETHAESSYGTKLSALETLRKIAKTILLADDTLGSEVRKEFQHETCLADVMERIVGSMTPEEQRRAGANTDAKGSLATKLRWVCDEAESYCLEGFDGLRHVLSRIEGPREPVSGHDRETQWELRGPILA
ncbi:hypothetical protein F5Y10DRAFT_101892 [Nemania abortiva]|nr:hypothetical protein F5Y10DRAFT_101892 [Nemania abortiva]